MSLVNEHSFTTIQFYATAPYQCSYLPNQEARSQVAAPGHSIHTQAYSALVDQGFRRSGLYTYRPHCDQCQACIPIRVACQQFKPTRSQQRAWKQHTDLIATIKPLALSEEHFDLYLEYQRARHPGGGMDDDCRSQYSQFLLASRVNSRLVEFRDSQQTLRMISIIDILEQGLSSVYTFYDPHVSGSLGTYGILWQLQECNAMQLPWLYLGYWIEQSQKMAYKSKFQPAQYLYRGQWHNAPPDTSTISLP